MPHQMPKSNLYRAVLGETLAMVLTATAIFVAAHHFAT